MPALQVPERLLASVGQEPGGVQQAWIDTLPTVLAEVCERWSLRVGPPFEPGGRSSWTAPAWHSRGPAVLKLGWRHDEAEHEDVALKAWAGDGAVRLHAAEMVGQTSALLVKRCWPGMTLGRAVAEGGQDTIIAGILLRLWATPVEGTVLRPLEQMCDQWAGLYRAAGSTGPAGSDPGLERLALRLFHDLPRSAACHVLLSTDLHAENVLSAQREPWLVIDPKPYVGDPTYDVLQHMLNCRGRLSSDPVGLCRRMACLTGVDNGRLLQWLFCRALLESARQPWLYEVARRVAP